MSGSMPVRHTHYAKVVVLQTVYLYAKVAATGDQGDTRKKHPSAG